MIENEYVKKAEEELEYLSGDAAERRLAELREKAIRDEAAAIAGATRRGIEKGIEKGKKEEKFQIAKKMLKESIEIETITRITGLTKEQIEHNVSCIKKQMERFIDFSDDKAILVNNADWLLNLNYVDFLRDVGVHFSVNRMLSAECFKQRLEKGLSFLEFNYMLMQGYDFYVLNQKYNCKMQLGGDDQWSNMIAGVELVRRKAQGQSMAMTCTLLTNSQGQKMGKTVGGALWLDPEKTSPFEFFQYWRNVDDADVEKCLALLTFLPMDEVRRLGALEGAEINKAKAVLAYEVTKLVHGEEEAAKAKSAAEALFAGGVDMSNVPTVTVSAESFGKTVLDVIAETKIVPSKAEGRRLIQQGGLSINGEKVTEVARIFTEEDIQDGAALIKRGKKNYHKIVVE